MQRTAEALETRTTTDIVFDKLHSDILALKLLPGARISEAEIATRLGVSRQPVRDAFNRLGNLGLLLIRPQRATEVRGFSMEEIRNARFVRLAVELEIIEQACRSWDEQKAEALEANLAAQRNAISDGKTDQFHALDYDFHKSICELVGFPLAFETIERCKRTVDRLCVLSLERTDEVDAVMQDHSDIADALRSGSVETARATLRRHLGRLDQTIEKIHEAHAEYFE